jgi:hypothetical protein
MDTDEVRHFAATDGDGFVTAFYVDDVHTPDQIPKDAIAIHADTHAALLDGQAKGKRMKVDRKGEPQLVDFEYVPTRNDVESARRRAYADPENGSDRFFVMAARMNVMGEAGAQEIAAQGVARYAAIRKALPWPATGKTRA